MSLTFRLPAEAGEEALAEFIDPLGDSLLQRFGLHWKDIVELSDNEQRIHRHACQHVLNHLDQCKPSPKSYEDFESLRSLLYLAVLLDRPIELSY